MRQVVGFLRIINRDKLIDFYTTISSYKFMRAKEIPSLAEFLQATLNESEAVTTFDETTDKFLEEQARKRFEERRQNVRSTDKN